MTGMKKLKTWLTVIMGLVLLAPGGAAAYTETISDTTYVIPYRGLNSTSGYNGGNPQDIIANNPTAWDIKKVGVTWTGDAGAGQIMMQIFTNYAPGGAEGAGQADIALRLGNTGAWTYGISMANVTGPATFTAPLEFNSSLVSVNSWYTSGTVTVNGVQWSNGQWYYAGAYR